MSECSKCGHADELDCPACDQSFCISCFVDHASACREETQKNKEKCSVCGRYASINPTVHCSDCQIEICRSCLYAHRKTHEEEKAKANWRYCVQCGLSKLASGFTECSICHGPVCENCNSAHIRMHIEHDRIHTHRCMTCGTSTTTECDECKKPFCTPCFDLHKLMVHEKKGKCAVCSNPAQEACLMCGVHYCALHQSIHVAQAHISYGPRFEYGNFDTKVHIDEDLLKNLRDAFDWAKSNGAQGQAQQFAKEETERLRKEEAERARQQKAQEEFFNNFWSAEQQSYSSSSDTYKQYYQSHTHREKQQTYSTSSAPSQELEKAFSLLQLSTRATVQEVKRAFKRKAKETHPDVGGSNEQFIKLNSAYELALSHAERNER